jgi:hypothetical protein
LPLSVVPLSLYLCSRGAMSLMSLVYLILHVLAAVKDKLGFHCYPLGSLYKEER